MLVKTWRFLTILLTALSLSLSVCHLMEMPQRLKFSAELWVRVTVFEGIFRYFGSVGALFEISSVVMALVLIFLVRGRRSSFYLTSGGALCLVIALASWLVFVAPVNAELARWLTNPIPPDFTAWRNQWEYAHAVNALIKILGFSLLVLSVLVEQRKNERKGEGKVMKATQIHEHMNVVGSDGQHVGTVDCVKENNLILTRSDQTAQGKHHAIPLSWVSRVEQNEVRLNQTTAEARQNWLDAENLDRQAASSKVCP